MRLGEKKREEVIDLLSERLAFERATVRLYDRVLAAVREAADPWEREQHATLQKHRDEEDETVRWLEGRIRELGADALAETDLARVATREARGIDEVAENDAADLSHLLHALLAVEGVDVAGWDLLVHLADDAGDTGTKHDLERRLRHERQHLELARRIIERRAIRTIFGEGYAVEHAMDLAANLPP
jgi:ferritin-like metal-binding protein YciE